MKKNKFLASLICATIMVTSFTGCGAKTETSTTTQTAGTTEQGAQDNVSTNLNMEGFPIVKEPITLSVFGQQAPLHDNWADIFIMKKYAEMSNIQLDYQTVPSQGFVEKKNLLFVGGEYPDIFVRAQLSPEELVKYGEQGILMDLTDLIPKYAPNYYKLMEEYPSIKDATTTPDGKIYSLSEVVTAGDPRTEKFWINKTWLDKEGLKVPTTVDEFVEVLKALKGKDLNGNGKADEIIFSAQNPNALINNLCGMWGLERELGFFINQEDGKLDIWLDNTEYKDMLMLLNSLYKEGLLDSEIFVQDNARWQAKLAEGILATYFNQGDNADEYNKKVEEAQKIEITGMAPLTGRSDKIFVKSTPIPRNPGAFAISTECENPEAALKWIDYFYSEEGAEFFRYGIEGETYQRDENGRLEYIDANQKYGAMSIFPGGAAPHWINEDNTVNVSTPVCEEAYKALESFVNPDILGAPMLTAEETGEISLLRGDVAKYSDEMAAKFIIGDVSFDKWDEYVATLEKMKIDELQHMYQDAYDRIKK